MIFTIVDKNKINIEDGNVLYAFLPASDLNNIMHQLFSGIYPDVPPFGVFFTQGNEKLRPATFFLYSKRRKRQRTYNSRR